MAPKPYHRHRNLAPPQAVSYLAEQLNNATSEALGCALLSSKSAMTTALDPAAIKSWEDAFQHRIPQVRQLERQLRADLASNKEKLRSLVG